MQVRVEVRAERVDRTHALFTEQVVQLAVNELHPLAVRRGLAAGIERKRAVEVVDHRQELLEETDHGAVGLLTAFALEALPVVVELGGLAEQPVVQIVAFPLQGGDGVFHGVRPWGLCRRRCLRIDGVVVGHRVC